VRKEEEEDEEEEEEVILLRMDKLVQPYVEEWDWILRMRNRYHRGIFQTR
jgi:hypothetical protein